MKLSNPIGFTRGPVTVITSIVYLVLITALIILHVSVPVSPRSSPRGVNLTEAWNDLQFLTAAYHPYNSKRNDEVHDWLLQRIKFIIAQNKDASSKSSQDAAQAFVFNDDTSNLTFSSPGSTSSVSGISVYFEGTNIIVYIRGSEDDEQHWWKDPKGKPTKRKGVLVNVHYDSVSTGFGATDDGVGVVSVLQLINYWTAPGNMPKNGLVLLLNNGEEDFLNGARVFSQHPMSNFVSTFLNLEGAGAGGKAILFRSTDTEVTKAYAQSEYPSGTVISGDGFNRGLIRSQTDYVIFNGILGMRGLDVAFTEPRARYHTAQDDARHTGAHSLWHMLSAALATTGKLTSSGLTNEPQAGTAAVWFDLFGRVLAVFQLHTLFALSVTLLVVAPVVLLTTMAILHQQDKLYLFSGSQQTHTRDGDVSVRLDAWRGFFRFPVIFAFSCAGPVALAYLLCKQNEFIAHSSEWAVWSMMFSAFLFVAWFLARAADYTRPSALTRAYGYSWMFGLWWGFLVITTVTETQYKLAGGYFVLFYFSAVFLVTWLSYLELLSLPTKKAYTSCKPYEDEHHSRDGSRARSAREVYDENAAEGAGEDEPTETTGLLAGRGRKAYSQHHEESHEAEEEKNESAEQGWSKSLWSWTWLVQFIILAPINIVLLGQIALLIVTSLHQTGPDGSSMFIVYLAIAIFSILLLSPLVPLIHRFTWHLPMFLLLVLVGTIIYNLVAFPFSANNRLKLFFQQEIDLTHGNNTVSLVGVTPYLQQAIEALPSAAGQDVRCKCADPPSLHSKRKMCSWTGLPPEVAGAGTALRSTFKSSYRSWLNFNVSRVDSSTARFQVHGANTRACKLQFNEPISSFQVHGSGPADKRMPSVPRAGSKEIRLWSRTWNRTWTVDVSWEVEDAKGVQGRVVCMWSDANHEGAIPAFDELLHFAPDWVAPTKLGDGLVEGYKKFTL